jgi:uncharacterized protein (TIGR03790 family)
VHAITANLAGRGLQRRETGGDVRVAELTLLAAVLAGNSTASDPNWNLPTVLLPPRGLDAAELAVVVNDLDPTSRRIAEYYSAKRRIPAENLIHVRFVPGRPVMGADEFGALYAQVRARTPERVQAYALTWAAPYRVGCMSITTAFAAGYDEGFCAAGCAPTRVSPYFASDSESPFAELGWRPTMALAGTRFEDVKALIDRGVAADETRPPGTGYLVNTSDKARTVRAQGFERIRGLFGSALKLERIDVDYIERKPDVLFYFTGLAEVPGIATNRFLPGAIADHLTSSGGQLTDSRQMSSLRWLEAGATGSYGSVVEPCNLPSKFPNPAILMAAYLTGATLIEAYWKGVEMPGQGIFIGEPLARPFGGYELNYDRGHWVLSTHALWPGLYELQAADEAIAPYQTIGVFAKPGFDPVRIRMPAGRRSYFRVVAGATRAESASTSPGGAIGGSAP